MAKKYKGIEHIKGDSYRIDFQVNKKRIQCRIQADSFKEARILRDERIVELRKNMPVSQNGQERYSATFDEAWEKLYGDLLADEVCKKNIHRHKRTFWKLFGEFREREYAYIENINQVTIHFLLGYKIYFINELGHDPRGGWKAEIVCIKSMLRRLRRLGFCSKEIIEELKDIKNPRPGKKEYPIISNNKLRAMLDFMKKDRPDYYYPIYFICRTGRRIEETTLIEKNDVKWLGINPVKIDIRGRITKTGEDAPIEKMDEDLQQVIREAYRVSLKRKTKYLFTNKMGRKCTAGRVRDYLKKVSGRMLEVSVTPHYFRHRFLTECGKANVPIVDIMAIAGIKDIGVVTRFYSHTTVDGHNKVLAVSRI
ncbi:MAG: site-specific integrase [Candidatus Aadella gelida]|nr:site-specific integrase [Candidatus Aadella gelida]